MAFDKGNVEIELAGQKHVLKSTPRAMRDISTLLGGTMGAYRQIAEQSVEAFIVVIAAGLNMDPRNAKIADELTGKIFESGGTGPLFDAVFLYCQTCLAGGNPPPKPDDETDASNAAEGNHDPLRETNPG